MIQFIVNYFKKKDRYFYLLLVVLFTATILRVYNFPYRYSLGEETVRDALIGIEGARQLQFPLTGAFSSLGPFTFGPWYAYQLIFATMIFRTVFAPFIYLTLISILYVYIMYRIGYLLGKEKFGLILGFLSAISPAQVISATHLTSHNTTNLFAVLALWIFLKIALKNISYWWGFGLGVVIGIGMNLHFQMSGLLILPLILLFYKFKRFFYFITCSLGVMVAFIPMFFFEANNHWFNTKNIIYFLLVGKNALYVPNRWLFYLRDFWPSFWGDALGVPSWAAAITIVLFIFTLFWSIYKKRIQILFTLLLIAFLFNFLLLRYYWGPKFFGYLNFIRPFVFIFTTFAIVSIMNLRKKMIFTFAGLIVIAAIIVLSIPRNSFQLIKDPFSTEIYETLFEIKKKYPNSNFALYTCSKGYSSYYNSVAFSLLFLLEAENRFDVKGVKLGLDGWCSLPYPTSISEVDLTKKISYPEFRNRFFDFSTTSHEALAKKGWKSTSFATLYDNYARWWFIEQP